MDTNINLNLAHTAAHTVMDPLVGNPVTVQAIATELQTALIAAEGIHWDPSQPLEGNHVTIDENPHGQIVYPWNPADPATDAFFERVEQVVGFEAWQEAEIAARATSFFAQVDRLLG